ncbi:MAG: TonB-dependent receptor [Bacteroides sp.]|uniref:SusC/RagA family TonB-linked outer membrane protein n=1 Tax=Bacteroides sp. TaxID=29523 RepID=UPI001B4B1087|nr:TonB-dependent receptor [Bacteroides sp.]MBP8090601.1 TonB-dependent receptor [Phocaeicola sp.]MBP6065895.1 TonB-dependent receptor [Bacteroides sp.]MBP6067842.1 TonB-dependent receptor [Bacteroides sp.]MBP8622874.1 TonB-dependent receptor [Bacteroides sp.]MBP9506379.1 TonB-dependent receptor [Bacteroides sp.]
MKKTIILMLCLLSSIGLMAQKKTITGTVMDVTGEAIIGATVIEIGSSNGVITDLDGKFTLSVNPNGKIRVTYVGYQIQEVDIKGKSSFNVTLKEDSQQLDEVVVTGYGGKQLRTKVTNSIAKVSEDVLQKGLFSNPAQALSGAVAGVRVLQVSGDPGSTPTIILRGGTDYNGTGSPLVLVDGQVRGSLSDINPEDISSMEVLKDAGATAIYGARANNGVILITTKRGKEGKGEVSVKAKVGLNYYNNPYEFMNAGDYLHWMRKAYQNSSQIYKDSKGAWQGITNMSGLGNATPYGTGNKYWADDAKTIPINGNNSSLGVWGVYNHTSDLDFLLNKGWKSMTDPVYGGKLIYKDTDVAQFGLKAPSLSQDYNINISGGNDKGNYYAGIGYNDTDGTAVGNWYKRLTFTLNADYKVKPWLTSNSSFSFADATWYGLSPGGRGEAEYFSRMFSLPPTFRGWNEDGEMLLGPNSGDGNQSYNLDKFKRDNNTDKFTMVQALDFRLMKGLNLKVTANWFFNEEKYEAFNRDYLSSPGKIESSRSTSASYSRTLDQTYNAVLNYDNQITKDHYLAAMLGVEYYDSYNKGFSASGSGAPTDDFGDLALTDSKDGKRSIDSWHSRQRIMSFFGRVNYDYQSKYLFSFVMRKDGYSKLAKENRWGVFPGVSAGWIFGKESFMQPLADVVSFAKLRASYGLNGNVNKDWVGNYTVQGSYGSSKYNGNTGYFLGALPNPYLQWERSQTFEVGLDLSFLENRINANTTFYNRLTTDKYATLPLPASSGVTGITSNNGEFRNTGVEMELGFRAIKTADWNWNINVNGAYNINKIISLPYNGLDKNRQNAMEVYTGEHSVNDKGEITYKKMWVGGYQEGRRPGDIYAYKSEGIYKKESDIPGNLIDKSTGNNGSNNKTLYGPEKWAAMSDTDKKNGLPIQPGDVKWKDVNGDGVIDVFDQVKVGNTTPKWTGGINTTVNWKSLTLSARFDFALGFEVVDWRTPWIMGNMQGTYNTVADSKETWTPENPNAKYPTYVWADQLGKRNYARSTSMFVYNGNYLALRELSLNYRLPKLWVNKAHMSNVDLSVTGQNLGYFTEAKHMHSPEQSSNSGGYPLPRTVIFGVNVSF